MDSDLYMDLNDVNGRDMNDSTSSQISCSYSRCNKVRHNAGCEGCNCRSVLSWEVPHDKRGFMREQWMVYVKSCVDESPLVVFKERSVYLFTGAHSHKFFCIDATSGLVLWEIKLQGRVESSAAIVNDFCQVIVECYDGNIYFLNFSCGTPCWNFQTHGEALQFGQLWVLEFGVPIFASLSVNPSSENVICCMVDGSIFALDTEGSVVWKVSTTGPIFAGACISRALPSQVLVSSRDGSVYSFDLCVHDPKEFLFNILRSLKTKF